MIADVRTDRDTVVSDYAICFQNIETTDFYSMGIDFSNLQIKVIDAVTCTFKAKTNAVARGQNVALTNIKEQGTWYVKSGDICMCYVSDLRRLGSNVWQYTLKNMDYIRFQIEKMVSSVQTYGWTERVAIGDFLGQNGSFREQYKSLDTTQIFKDDNIYRTYKRYGLAKKANWCDGFDIATFTDSNVNRSINWCYAKFLPSKGTDGKFTIKIGDSVFDCSDIASTSYSTNSVERMTVTACFPYIPNNENNPTNDTFYRNNLTYKIPKIRDVGASPNLINVSYLPFGPVGINISSVKRVSGTNSFWYEYTFSKSDTRIGEFASDTSNLSLMFISYFDNGVIAKPQILDIDLLLYELEGNLTDTSRILDKGALVTFNYGGIEIPFSIGVLQQYKDNGISKIDLQVVITGDGAVLRVLQYDGSYNYFTLKAGGMIITDAWQEYVAQNKNYKDTLYNIPMGSLNDDYKYQWNKLNAQNNLNSNTMGDIMSTVGDMINSFVSNLKPGDRNAARDEYLEDAYNERHNRPFMDLNNSYSIQSAQIKASYDNTVNDIKNTPNKANSRVSLISFLNDYYYTIQRCPQGNYNAMATLLWTHGTECIAEPIREFGDGDEEKGKPPQFIVNKNSIPLGTANVALDPNSVKFIKETLAGGVVYFKNLKHYSNFCAYIPQWETMPA